MSQAISIEEFRKIKKRPAKQLANMQLYLTHAGINFTTEYQFHEKRKFRFDIAIVEKKIAIEYEGLMSRKSGHTTPTGYTSNCEKYNLAQLMGWKVLRYTVLNYQMMMDDVRKLLKYE